jgi:hypothetical protein
MTRRVMRMKIHWTGGNNIMAMNKAYLLIILLAISRPQDAPNMVLVIFAAFVVKFMLQRAVKPKPKVRARLSKSKIVLKKLAIKNRV